MELSADTLRALTLTPPEIADAIESAFAERAAGRAGAAPKSMILPPDGRLLMTMRAACERCASATARGRKLSIAAVRYLLRGLALGYARPATRFRLSDEKGTE